MTLDSTNRPRLANVARRATLMWSDGSSDVAAASNGRFGDDPQALFEDWDPFSEWAASLRPDSDVVPSSERLGPPAPRPRQVFAIGLNYRAHAGEAGYDTSAMPQVFTKFPSSLTGPFSTVAVVSPRLDWEVELVVVIGAGGYRLAEEKAWDSVAGVMVGQDLSARDVQLSGQSPQWSLGKSFPGAAPTGPCVVSVADLPDPDDLGIECTVNDVTMQNSRTSALIWSVPELLARVSSVCRLLPGDLVFTGTPAGVGNRRDPPQYLQPGDRLVSRIEGLGELTTTFSDPEQRTATP